MDADRETRSRRSRKKSKSKNDQFDDEFFDKQMRRAAKQMEMAMEQVKLARKVEDRANMFVANADKIHKQVGDGLVGKNPPTIINHFGHSICINNADNIQVGSHNTMVVMKDSRKGKKSSGRRKSGDSEEDEIEDVAEEKRGERKAEQADELDPYVEQVLGSERLVTVADLDLASQNVGKDWRRLLRFLSLDDALISQLNQDYHVDGVRHVVFQGMLSWKRQAGREATLGKLSSTLKRVGYVDTVKLFKL